MSVRKKHVQFLKTIGALGQEMPIKELLSSIKSENTHAEIVSLNCYPKLTNLEYLTYETFVSMDIVKTVRQSSLEGVDAIVIGCFFDPAIDAAREISGEMIVVGSCQASLQTAANLARKFSIIIGQEKWSEHLKKIVSNYGYGDNLASLRSIDIPVDQLQSDCDYTKSQIIKAGRKAIEEDGAEALILGCTCTYGLFSEVQNELGVPVIDPVYAAFKSAEFLADTKQRFGWVPSRVGSCLAPTEEALKQFGLFETPPAIKGRFQIS